MPRTRTLVRLADLERAVARSVCQAYDAQHLDAYVVVGRLTIDSEDVEAWARVARDWQRCADPQEGAAIGRILRKLSGGAA